MKIKAIFILQETTSDQNSPQAIPESDSDRSKSAILDESIVAPIYRKKKPVAIVDSDSETEEQNPKEVATRNKSNIVLDSESDNDPDQEEFETADEEDTEEDDLEASSDVLDNDDKLGVEKHRKARNEFVDSDVDEDGQSEEEEDNSEEESDESEDDQDFVVDSEDDSEGKCIDESYCNIIYHF